MTAPSPARMALLRRLEAAGGKVWRSDLSRDEIAEAKRAAKDECVWGLGNALMILKKAAPSCERLRAVGMPDKNELQCIACDALVDEVQLEQQTTFEINGETLCSKCWTVWLAEMKVCNHAMDHGTCTRCGFVPQEAS